MAFAECPRIMSRKKSTGSSEAVKTDSRSVRPSPVGAFAAASGVTCTVLSAVNISTLSDLRASWTVTIKLSKFKRHRQTQQPSLPHVGQSQSVDALKHIACAVASAVLKLFFRYTLSQGAELASTMRV